ncbi:T9SS type A sorting domain-containing protein [bacterium SCSIO 12643]|nr:T9SS type A sorting domain-containing protein [bacterium SCSIO 12643]
MRFFWIIILFGLGSQLGAQSTYFNMRYPETGAWGSGTRAIVNQNDSLYVNIGYNFNAAGFKSQTFSTMNITNGSNTLGVRIEADSTEVFSGSLIGYSQGGFYDVMSIESITDSLVYRYMVVKYDVYGDTVFTKTYIDNSLFLSVLDVVEDRDEGLVFVGRIQTIPANQMGTEDIILIKTDSLGNELWRRVYGNTTNFEQGFSVQITPDSGYIIGGAVYHPDFSDEQRPYIIKIDSVGNVEWEQTYGAVDTNNLPVYNIINTQDGGYAFVGGLGVMKYTGSDTHFPWIVKLDSQGNIMWSKMNKEGSPSPVFSEYHDLIELADGSLVVCGTHVRLNLDTVNFKGKYSTMGVIAKYSANGDSLWSRSFVHPENVQSPWSDHFFNSIVQTDDGGFAAAGYLLPNPPDTGTQDTWVVKVDSFGCLVQGCEVVSVPQIETSIAALKIYPNPTHNLLNIEITPNGNPRVYDFELYDLLGKRVLTQKLQSYQNTISVSGLASGIYTYKIDEVWGKIVIE